jgi:hypothetical protein
MTLGSLGSAYRAKDPATGRSVALKVLPPELSGSIAARDRFQREAARAKKVSSPNLVNVLDFGDASGTWYLAMELVEGTTLAEHVQSHGALESEAARDVLVQAARALALLHGEGLVPRDVSADNFRVSGEPDATGRLAVKLLDIGLLRPADDESISDVRAAVGALGPMAYFLLTGRTGKPDLGALAGDVSDEFRGVLRRLVGQRAEERYATPTALLEALGEDEPAADEPAAKAEADEIDPLAALAEQIEEKAPPRRAPAAKKPPRRRDEDEDAERVTETAPPMRGGDTNGDEEDEPMPPRKPRPAQAAGIPKGLIWGGAAFAGALIVGLIVWLALRPDDTSKSTNRQAQNTNTGHDPTPPPGDTAKDKPGDSKKEPPNDKPKDEVQPATVPWLYDLKTQPDRLAVEKEHLGPWVQPAAGTAENWPARPAQEGWWRWWTPHQTAVPRPPEGTPVFQVARVLPPTAKPGIIFDSIAAACAAIPEGKWGIVEIEDNGPFFEPPIHVSGRNVYLRGGNGYAPLIIWDLAQRRTELKPGKPAEAPPRDEVPAFITVEKGTLLLDNVHLAVDWPEKASGSGCLVRVSGGDLRAWESTFSAAGKPHTPVTAVRFEGGPERRCRLTQCFTRGARLTALDLPTPGADVMIDLSLLVTTDAPLLSVAGGKGAEAASTLRLIRSTLVARDTVLQVRPPADAPAEPALHCLGWDVLLLRAAENPGGTMIDLPKGAGTKEMTWHAVNCLYAGWETLISGSAPIAGDNEAGWHSSIAPRLWDRSLPHLWAKSMPADPAEVIPITYQTGGTSVAYQATYAGPGFLGADLLQMPWARLRWVDITTQRARPMDPSIQDDKPASVPQAADLLYHGERLDLDKIPDLGAYLRDVAKRQQLAHTIVLHLHGTGKHKTRPIRVEGSDLFIYVEPAAKDAEPLVLEPDVSVAPDANALFEVSGGNLWLVGVDVRCPDFKTALLPKYVVMVNDGSLLVAASRLQGPLTQPPPNYWGLIRVEGTALPKPGGVYTLSINQSVLLSAKYGIHLMCAGMRVHMQQSLIVSTDRAITIQTAKPPQKNLPLNMPAASTPIANHSLWGEAFLNMEITADHCTFAAKESVFYLYDVPVETRPGQQAVWPVIADPILVQTRECAFLYPFADKESKSGAALLAYIGAGIPRGLLCWQGEGNVYDKRLHAYVMGVTGPPPVSRLEKPQPFTVWERLWGPGESKPILDLALKDTLDLEKLPLNLLALPTKAGQKDKPGADFKKLLERRQVK